MRHMQVLLPAFVAILFSGLAQAEPIPCNLTPTVIVSTDNEPLADGPFEPTWQSLERYKVPKWFRDAKFGIWAHWDRNASRSAAIGTLGICMFKATGSMRIT